MSWSFKREEQSFDVIPEGRHRIRIKEVEKAVSNGGNDMLVFKFEVSGYKGLVFHYLTFLCDKPEVTNRMLTQFFDSFEGIPEGDFNTANWVGKGGAATIKHEEYNGETRAKIGYFIKADKAKDLPPWRDAAGSSEPKTDENGYMQVDDEDVPF